MKNKTKSENRTLYSKAEKKTVITKKGIEEIHLSFELECKKKNFESYIRRSAELLETYDLEKVKTFSIHFKLLD